MIDNREIITINTYPLPFKIELRAFLVMILFFVLGMLFGFLVFSQKMISKSISNFKDRRRLQKLEKAGKNISTSSYLNHPSQSLCD
jgi:hypothetical protein